MRLSLAQTPFAQGATAQLHPASAQQRAVAGGAPTATPLDTAVVSSAGALEFAGLDADTGYWVVAQDSQGAWRWVQARTAVSQTAHFTVDDPEDLPFLIEVPADQAEDVFLIRKGDDELVSIDENGVLHLGGLDNGAGIVNVKSVGALGDGVTDDTAAIQEALDYASSSGLKLVFAPAGTYLVTGLLIPEDVSLYGAGLQETTFKLKNGANADVLKTATFETLTGTDSTDGAIGVTLRDFRIDGNKANNAAGRGICIYGCDYRLQRVRVFNTAGRGIVSEWAPSTVNPPDLVVQAGTSMEAVWDDVKVLYAGSDGIYFDGPHDGSWTSVHAIRNGAKGIWITDRAAGLLVTNSHSWGFTQTYAWDIESTIVAANMIAEGATVAQIRLKGVISPKLRNVWCFGNDLVNQRTGIEIDGATGYLIEGVLQHFPDAAIKFTDDGGSGKISVLVQGDTAPVTVLSSGTQAFNTVFEWMTSNPAKVTAPAGALAGIHQGTQGPFSVRPDSDVEALWAALDRIGVRFAKVHGGAATRELQLGNAGKLAVYSDDFATRVGRMEAAGIYHDLLMQAAQVIAATKLTAKQIVGTSGVEATAFAIQGHAASYALTAGQPAASDVRGCIDVTMDGAPAADGSILRITFGVAFPFRPTVILQPLNGAAVDAGLYIDTANLFMTRVDIKVRTAPAPGAVLQFAYFVVG